MSPAELVMLALKASIIAIVFALGLTAKPSDLLYLLKRPAQLAKSLLSMFVIMPVAAFALVSALNLPRPAAIMLVALSLAPVPPLLPRKHKKAGGDAAYSVGLLAVAGIIAVIWIPVALEIEQRVFALELGIAPAAVAKLVAMTILAPLAAGMVFGSIAPKLALRLGPTFSKVGGSLLLLAAALILVAQWRAIVALLNNGTVAAMAAFVVIGLVVGHLLGGPAAADRTVLAMATASRHPGVALAIAHTNFPDESALAAAVLVFLLTNALLSFPYIAWRKRAGASDLEFA